MSAEHPLKTSNIFGSLRNLSEYLSRGLTRPRSISCASVTSVFDTCMMSKLYFQNFCVVFSWVKSFG